MAPEYSAAAAAAAAKSLQSCPTLCDPRDGLPPGAPSLGLQYTPNRDRLFSAVYNTGPGTVLSVCVLISHSYEAGTAASTLILQTMNLKCKR